MASAPPNGSMVHVYWYLEDHGGSDALTPDMVDRIRDAAEVWNDAGANVQLVEVFTLAEADIHVHGHSTSPCNSSVSGCAERSYTLTETKYADGHKHGRMVKTQTLTMITKPPGFGSTYTWYAGADPEAIGFYQYDYTSVAIQEFGHHLGLGHADGGDGHPDSADSPMTSSLANNQTHRVLQPSDITAIQHLYGSSSAPPGNNDCVDSITLVEGVSVNETTVNATGSTTSSCGNGDTKSLWYDYTPQASGTVTVSLCGSSFDTTLSIFDSCGGNELACNDNSCGRQSEITLAMTVGVTYFIRVSGQSGENGEFDILVTGGGAGCVLDYDNTTEEGPYFPPGSGVQVLDFGTASGGNVCEFTFGYYTTLDDPGTITVELFSGTNSATCAGTPLATFDFNGLQGSGRKYKTYEVPPAEAFSIPSGQFGYALTFSNGSTGMLISSGGAGQVDNVYINCDWGSFGEVWSGMYFNVVTGIELTGDTYDNLLHTVLPEGTIFTGGDGRGDGETHPTGKGNVIGLGPKEFIFDYNLNGGVTAFAFAFAQFGPTIDLTSGLTIGAQGPSSSAIEMKVELVDAEGNVAEFIHELTNSFQNFTMTTTGGSVPPDFNGAQVSQIAFVVDRDLANFNFLNQISIQFGGGLAWGVNMILP